MLQADEYFAYGLPIDDLAFKKDDIVPNRFLYQGKEWMNEDDLSLAMYDFHARMYDPALGRFMATDPQNQFGSPYLGMGNNPTMMVDPDGEFAFVPMLIGAAISVITNGINNAVNNQPFFQGAGKAALIGGIGGAFSFGIGQAVRGMSAFGQIATQSLAHAHLGGVMSSMNGSTYGQGFLSGFTGSLIGAGANLTLHNAGTGLRALGTVSAGAVAGGVGAEIVGGNFWDGARNGAISAGLNHAYHSSLKPKIFVRNYDESLNQDKFMELLENHLISNGFSSRLDVIEESIGEKFWAWAKGNPNAHVDIRDFYSSGAPLDAGVLGYAKPGSNEALVYGKGIYFGKSYNPSIIDLVNVTTHELGHAIFSFHHSKIGIMNAFYRLGSPLIDFNSSHRSVISNSVWSGL
jgi:RHS repeat-associated protein